MAVNVVVEYTVVCDTVEEYDDLLAAVADTTKWSVSSRDAAQKRVLFSGTYVVAPRSDEASI